jgi:uncharacterized protein Yka (UPF0111/DUF47 family)
MKIFLPKDRVFYSLFEQVADKVTLMGKLLQEFVYETDEDKRLALSKQIEDLEHQNDELTHQIFQELGRNFITPFDREDIHYLPQPSMMLLITFTPVAKKFSFTA